MSRLTSRERIEAALQREPVDRVPIDLGGTRQSGIAAIAYHQLKQHLGLGDQGSTRVFDVYQMLAEIEPVIAERYGTDCVGLNRPAVAFGIENRDWKSLTLMDDTPVEVPGGFEPEEAPNGSWMLKREGEVIAEMPKNGFYFDRYEKYPGALHPDLEEWEPPRLKESDLAYYKEEAARLYEETDRAVIAAMGPPYELFNGIGQGGFEEWILTFASEPEYVERLYEKLVDRWIENLEAFHGAVGDRVQVLQIADDFGAQNAPLLSPAMFEELLLPAYKRGLDWVHQRTNWKVLLHSDGALIPLLPLIVEMGVDILNPVQTTATGMEPTRLKAEFGDQLIFWGGSCDCQGTLTFGKPADVEREVLEHLRAFETLSGGHVFAGVHNIQANVPPENIETLFQTALNYHG